MAGAKLPKWGFCDHKTPGQRLADCGKSPFNTSHLGIDEENFTMRYQVNSGIDGGDAGRGISGISTIAQFYEWMVAGHRKDNHQSH